jgi:hypothetical protein
MVPQSRPGSQGGGGNRPSINAGGGRNDRNRPDLPNRPGTGGNRPGRPDQPSIGGGNRPGRPDRPGIGGGNRPERPDRPNIGGGNRPGRPDRPNIGGGNRPERPDRPNIGGGNRPERPDRPGIGGGNRPERPDRPGIGGGNRPGTGGNRPGLPDRPGIGGGDNVNNWPNRPIDRPSRPPNRPIFINNRPIIINNIRPGSRPWYDYHYHHWHRGYWNWWRPTGWIVGGVAAGWMLAPSQPIFVYSNPFYDQSVTVFDYSQSLPPPPVDPANDVESLDAAESAIEIFEQAREAFGKGAYKDALALVDKSIEALPTDVTLHEFRALCFFALKDYRQAAAALYAVLAAGPGWDWETMKYLYPDVETYTKQLRALEDYQGANPKSAEGSFVLTYQYLVLGHIDAAIKQMENVVKLLPESQLSAELLAALKEESSRASPG